jgi:hypothetical protein
MAVYHISYTTKPQDNFVADEDLKTKRVDASSAPRAVEKVISDLIKGGVVTSRKQVKVLEAKLGA